MIKKNVVAGIGEIGGPIAKLLSKTGPTVTYDIKSRLMNKQKYSKYKDNPTSFLHVCIPFTNQFSKNVKSLFKKFSPDVIVIHSTIAPNTISQLQKKLNVPIIYSPIRGVHKRMLQDLKRYTKFYAIEPYHSRSKWVTSYARLMKKCGVKTKIMKNPLTLELSKIIVVTSYYGWLINYAQLSKMISNRYGIDYDEMWSFADEIHKILGNRPKMFPGFIAGHCVIPNLDLISDKTLNLIKEINLDYAKIPSKRRKQGKKY